MLVITATTSSTSLAPVSVGTPASTHPPALVLLERGDVAVAKACQPVFVLDHQHTYPRISQQPPELGALIIQAGRAFGHCRHHLLAACHRVGAYARNRCICRVASSFWSAE